MTERSNSGISNSVIPNTWVEARLDDVCEVLDKYRKPINNNERTQRLQQCKSGEKFPYYGATGMVGYIDDYLLEGDFVLLGEDGAPFLDPCKAKAYTVSGKIWVNNHAHILKAHVSNKYLMYYLNQFNYREYVTGTTRLKLNQSLMRSIPVKYAPSNEQHRIVEKIEELFSEIDKGVESLGKAKAQLEVYRHTVLQSAYEGKLTAKRRTGKVFQDIASPLSNESISEEIVLRLTKIPEEWRYTYLSNLGNLSRGKSKHRPRNAKELYENGKYPFVQTGDVKAASKHIRKYSQTYNDFGLLQSKMWPVGTLCITIAANIAETAFLGFDACFPDSIVGFIADENVVNVDYVYYFFEYSQKKIEAYAPATAQKNINLKTLENLLIPLTSLEEQHQIVQEIESRLSVCDKVEESIEQGLKQAEMLKQSVLKKAFEGKLVPQNPEDEPVSVLLERVRQERESLEKAEKASSPKTKKKTAKGKKS